MRNRRIRQLIHLFFIIALVLSNLVTPYDNPAFAQSSLRQKATFQAKDSRQDLEVSLAEPSASSKFSSAGRGLFRDTIATIQGEVNRGDKRGIIEYTPFGKGLDNTPHGPARELLEAIKEVEKRFGKGAVVIYGGAVRDLLLGKADLSGDIDILVRTRKKEDPKLIPKMYKILNVLEEALGLSENSIFERRARKGSLRDGFSIDLIGSYHPVSKKVTPSSGLRQFIGNIQLSINTLLMRSDATIVDVYGGIEDLKEGIIRFVGANPQKYANHQTILRAVRFKHQLGFKYDEATRDMVENFFKNPERFKEGLRWKRWLGKVKWLRSYIAAKRRGDLEEALNLVYEFINQNRGPLRKETRGDRYSDFTPGDAIYLNDMDSARETGDLKKAISCFEWFMERGDRWPEGINVEVNLAEGKRSPSQDDPYAIGVNLRDIIKNARDPEAAARELKDIGFGEFLEASGIDIEEVLTQRRNLDNFTQDTLPYKTAAEITDTPVLAGAKSSSAGEVTELPRVEAGPYIERIDCVRRYLGRLAKVLGKDEEFLGELNKADWAEEFSKEVMDWVRKRRIRLKQAQINIKRLSSSMKEQSLRAFINALKATLDGEARKVSRFRTLTRLRTLAFLFVKEINKHSPAMEFNLRDVLFIPKNSWFSDMFDFDGAGMITEISDGRDSVEILLIEGEERSLSEIIKSILHETKHKKFTPGRRIAEEAQPEILPFYNILEEAMTESIITRIFENLKKTELGEFLLDEIPEKGVYDELPSGEYYLYEQEFLNVMKKKFEGRAEKCVEEFLVEGNPEPLKEILGPLWERFVFMAGRAAIYKHGLAYDTVLRMMFLFLPHPDAVAKLDAGILFLGALEDMDFKDIDEIEYEFFMEFWPDSISECKDKAVIRAMKDILKSDKTDLERLTKADFQDRLYRYTIEEVKKIMRPAKGKGRPAASVASLFEQIINAPRFKPIIPEVPEGLDHTKSSSAGVIADERYIQNSGYNVIGGTKNRWLSKRLTDLTGVNALAHNPAVYSPLHDAGHHEPVSLEFASAAAEQIKELAARFKPQGKDSIRILVIGSGTGIDALCPFHHARFVEQFESVTLHAIDIQEEAVEDTKFNFTLRLPGSRFEGDSLQFAGEGFKNDTIIVKRVVEGEEFDGLEGVYDLILFHAPDAVGPRRIYDTRVEMDQSVFKAILGNIREHLSDDGIALVKNQWSIIDAGLIPAGFDVTAANSGADLWAILVPPERASWTIFKLTLDKTRQQGRPSNTGDAGGLTPSSKIKILLDAEKAIAQAA